MKMRVQFGWDIGQPNHDFHEKRDRAGGISGGPASAPVSLFWETMSWPAPRVGEYASFAFAPAAERKMPSGATAFFPALVATLVRLPVTLEAACPMFVGDFHSQ